jgi:hypothetical protein
MSDPEGKEGNSTRDPYLTLVLMHHSEAPVQACSSVVLPLPDYVPEGGVPDGGVPEGRVPFNCIPPGGDPEGRVPFICMPSGGVPEGRVPFISTPSGCVSIGPADSLNRDLLPVPASGFPDGDSPPASPAGAVSTGGESDGIGESVLLVSTDELLSEQPAARIPATRIADATSIMILLFCIEFFS